MRGNVLYDRSTTLPNIHGHFRRPRIDKLLDELLSRQLIAVTAGAGWGKTHAISAYLRNAPVRSFWLQLSELDNHITRFWDEFIYIIGFQDTDTATQLEQLGFPETIAKFDKFLRILAKVIYSREQVVFVFDDFHLIHEESILRFVQNLIFAKLENFCVIINSRLKLIYNLTGMITNDLAYRITTEELYFTQTETEDYLKQLGVTLPEREIKKVQELTEGWPLAIYLVSLSIKKGGVVSKDSIVGAIPLIFELIENELYSEYAPNIKSFLIKASLLNSFPEGLIKALAGNSVDDILEFIDNNMFINHNPYTSHYNFHHLFLEFLNGKQKKLKQQEIADTYLKAAEWCVANDLKIEALVYYDKCGCYDEILNIMVNFGVAIFSKTIAELYINLIDNFPAKLMKDNPLLHVHHAGLLYNNAEVQPAINELLEAQKEMESLPPTEGNKFVLGEICCLLGLISLGMGDYNFVDYFIRASEYLPDGSFMFDNNGTVVNTRYAIMLNNPSPGELKKMEDAMFYAMPYASKVMRGYGQGMDYLASAEAAYFTGDMKKATKNAYEAIYRARDKQVIDVASSGYFLLMRIEAANGNYEGVISNLTQMKSYAESFENKWNFNGMPDVAEGWFNLLIKQTEKIADWLVDDTLGGNVLAPYSMGMERTIKARYLLMKGKYYELLAWLGQSEKPLRQYKIWLVLLDNLICKAIAFHHLRDEEQTIAALREAYEIAHENDLIMQFVELGNDIRAVVYNVRNNKLNVIPVGWLDEIYAKATTYEKHMRNLKSQSHQVSESTVKNPVKLTKREKETLEYLCQGLTNPEIASASFITISAVKKMLNNIYIKLDATNRTDAVRIAIQMGLHK